MLVVHRFRLRFLSVPLRVAAVVVVEDGLHNGPHLHSIAPWRNCDETLSSIMYHLHHEHLMCYPMYALELMELEETVVTMTCSSLLMFLPCGILWLCECETSDDIHMF